MNPWPGAFTWLPSPEGPRKLKVFSCIQHRRAEAAAGTVVHADKHVPARSLREKVRSCCA
jgi:hypothetical protein